MPKTRSPLPQLPGNGRAARLLTIAAVAGGYFVLGRLAIALAIPPGYAAPIWPAAGLAVAAVVLLGQRIWPGIFAGSLLVNLSIGLLGDAGEPVLVVASATLIAVGATLQALAAGYLVGARRSARPRFESGREVTLFLLTVGPVACVVNALAGPLVLTSLGILEATEIPFTSWNWWIGDTIGVIVVTPIALISAGWAGARWQRRRFQIAGPMLLAVVVVVVAFVHSSNRDLAHIDTQFANSAAIATAAIENELSATLDTVNSMRSFFDSSSRVTREEFSTFASGLLRGHAELLALSWNPYLSHAQRVLLEQGAGEGPRHIMERNADGDLIVAPPAPDYVLVRYIEPFAANAPAIGFNVLSESTRRAAIEAAIATGRPSATGRVGLVQDGTGRSGLLLFAPVYAAGTRPHAGTPARPDGFVVAVVLIDNLVRHALERVPTRLVSFRLFDASDNRSRLGIWPQSHAAEAELTRSQSIHFAGRDWLLEIAAGRDYIAENRAESLWLILAGGLLLSGMLGAFLIVMTGHEVSAQQRRDELQRLNTELKENIARRHHVERELWTEKARAQATLHSIADGVIATGAGQKIEYMNPVAEQLTGWSSHAALGQPLDKVLILQAEDGAPSTALALLRSQHEDAGLDGGLWLTSRSGERYAIRQSLRELQHHDSTVGGYVIAFQDVTAARRAAQEIARQATRDPLTDILNRGELERRMRHAISGAQLHQVSHTFCFLDLDHFKQVNDTAGHATGDKLLQEICALIRKRIRARDTLARLGGDEFGLLLDHCPIARGVEIAEEIANEVNEYRIAWREKSLGVGVSIGVTAITAEAGTVDEVLHAADLACYAAKSSGRGRVLQATRHTDRAEIS